MPKLILLLTATWVAGCVNLDKPKVIEECAAAHNCSGVAIPEPGRDANEDTPPPSPDLPYRDTPTPKEDMGPDSPIADAPADQADQGPDKKDVTGTDATETGISSDADTSLPPADSGPDLAPDTIRQDGGPDLGPDLAPDLAPDLRPDLPPDLAPDLRPDLPPDLAPDLRPDLPPDVQPDTSTLASGLLAYYKCESATGTTLPDSSGKNNNGTLAAAGYTFAAGKVGNALTLAKASSAYVTLPAAMFANVTDITVAAWVNISSSANWARIFDVGVNAKLANNTATGTHYVNLVPQNDANPSNLAFAISNDGYGSEQKLTTTALATGTWKHVAVVLASGQGSLYVDGALVTGPSAIALRPVDLGTIDYAYLGKSQFTADPYFDGQIDEFRVYGRALSAAEIKAVFQFAGP